MLIFNKGNGKLKLLKTWSKNNHAIFSYRSWEITIINLLFSLNILWFKSKKIYFYYRIWEIQDNYIIKYKKKKEKRKRSWSTSNYLKCGGEEWTCDSLNWWFYENRLRKRKRKSSRRSEYLGVNIPFLPTQAITPMGPSHRPLSIAHG